MKFGELLLAIDLEVRYVPQRSTRWEYWRKLQKCNESRARIRALRRAA